ncbi:MAG: hypothetical protein LBU12_00130 [Deltaproteobacteria bacterium]|jgi:hypothetical protein|nr:hypothetical protein [Deltaproteobacteria bacterium]
MSMAPPEEIVDQEKAESSAKAAELARLKAGLQQFVVTMKNLSLYPETSKANKESLKALHLWFDESLRAKSPLILEVTRDTLIDEDGEIAYQEKSNEQIFTGPLFRDGIQTLIFEYGVTELELKTFMSVLLRFRVLSEDENEDLVTALWETSLNCIKYVVSTEYEQVAPEFEISAMKAAKPPLTRPDPNSPWGDEADAPMAADGAAPVAKPIASLFALASAVTPQLQGPDDGLTFEDGLASFASVAQGPGGFEPLADSEGGQGVFDANGFAGEADGSVEDDEEDDGELDLSSAVQALMDMESTSLSPGANTLNLGMFKERKPGKARKSAPEVQARLASWGLSSHEIQQVNAFIGWDEERNYSFDSLEIILTIFTSPAYKEEYIPLISIFLINELKLSLRKLDVKYFNNFLAHFREILPIQPSLSVLDEKLNEAINSTEFLGLLLEPSHTEAAWIAAFEDLRWFLYQVSPAGVQKLLSFLPKTTNYRLWNLIIEVTAYTMLQTPNRALELCAKLNDKALTQVIRLWRASVKGLPASVMTGLLRHKSPVVRGAAAKALLDHARAAFEQFCPALVLDPDPTVQKVVRSGMILCKNRAAAANLEKHLQEAYQNDRNSVDPGLLDCYRTYGLCAGESALPFLGEVLLHKDFKSILSRSTDSHRLGAALALISMTSSSEAQSILARAAKSSFRNIRQACQEGEKVFKELSS